MIVAISPLVAQRYGERICAVAPGSELFLENLRRFVTGHPLRNRVRTGDF